MSEIVIGKFGPSACQIVEAACAAMRRPRATVVVGSVPEGSKVLGGAEWSGSRRKDYERGLAYLHDLCSRRTLKNQVFLGGACGATTWRQDIAIPMLEKAGVEYLNPQIEDWDEQDAYWKAQGVKGGIMEVEAREKIASHVILFPFASTTRGIASLSEAIEFISEGRQKVVLVMADLEPGTVIDGQTITQDEADDINDARIILEEFARAMRVPVYRNIARASEAVVTLLKEAEQSVTVPEVYTCRG